MYKSLGHGSTSEATRLVTSGIRGREPIGCTAGDRYQKYALPYEPHVVVLG